LSIHETKRFDCFFHKPSVTKLPLPLRLVNEFAKKIDPALMRLDASDLSATSAVIGFALSF
jgi:hypothetical protein